MLLHQLIPVVLGQQHAFSANGDLSSVSTSVNGPTARGGEKDIADKGNCADRHKAREPALSGLKGGSPPPYLQSIIASFPLFV